LMLEDRLDLAPQLVLRQRYKYISFLYVPLLPRSAIVPYLRLLSGIFRKSALNCLETHAVSSVRVAQIARNENVRRPSLLDQREGFGDVLRTDWILPRFSGLVKRKI